MQRQDFPGSPLGLHRVIEPAGALPQAAWRVDPSPRLWPDEVRVRVERLNLDAACPPWRSDAGCPCPPAAPPVGCRAMTSDAVVIVQIPRGSAVDQYLRAYP